MPGRKSKSAPARDSRKRQNKSPESSHAPTEVRHSALFHRFDAIAIGLLILGVAIVFGPALFNGFVNYDDQEYVSENKAVKNGLTWNSIAYAWTTFHLGNWIPLTWMSYELDTTLFGTAPAGYIFTNLTLHALNCCLLYLFLRLATGQAAAGFVAAVLFAIHPQHVESVAWIAERKDVLSTFFLLLTLLAWQRYVASPRWQAYAAVVIAFVLGLLSKSMLVTLPVLLLLLDIWPFQRWPGPEPRARWKLTTKLIGEKVPLLVISFIFGIVTIVAQNDTGALATTEIISPAERLTVSVKGIAATLYNTFLPTQLSPFYPVRDRGNIEFSWLPPLVCLMIPTVIAILLRRRSPYLLVGWLWFLIAILPVSGILQVGSQAYADRYSYIPHIGIFVAITYALFSISNDWKFTPVLKLGISLFVSVFFAFLTSLQIGYWQNPISLWTHALNVDRENWMAHYMLGDYLRYEQHPHEALAYLKTAETLQPGSPDVHRALAETYAMLGDSQMSIAHGISAVKIRPRDRETRIQLTSKLIEAKRYHEARAVLEDGQKYFPHDDTLSFGLGNLAKETGDLPTAIGYFEGIIRRNPDNRKSRILKAACLIDLHRPAEATEVLSSILLDFPRDIESRLMLAKLHIEREEQGKATALLEQILAIDANHAEAKSLLQQIAK